MQIKCPTCHHLLSKDAATVRHAYMCTSVSRMLHLPYKCTCTSSSAASSWRRRIRPVSCACHDLGSNLMSHRTNPRSPVPNPLSVVLDSKRGDRNPNKHRQKKLRVYDKTRPDHQSTPTRYRTREEHNSTRQPGSPQSCDSLITRRPTTPISPEEQTGDLD